MDLTRSDSVAMRNLWLSRLDVLFLAINDAHKVRGATWVLSLMFPASMVLNYSARSGTLQT